MNELAEWVAEERRRALDEWYDSERTDYRALERAIILQDVQHTMYDLGLPVTNTREIPIRWSGDEGIEEIPKRLAALVREQIRVTERVRELRETIKNQEM